MPKKHRSPQRAHGANSNLRTVKMYPVYSRKLADPENVMGETPLLWIDKPTRDTWLSQGAVTSYTRGTMVRLTINLPPRPQVSITTRGLSDGVVMGRAYATACLAAWGARDRKPVPRWEAYGG